MTQRVLVINGHPDPSPERLCSALAAAYCEGATRSGKVVRRIDVGALDVPFIRSAEEFESGQLSAAMLEAQAAVAWADHLTIIHPLWLGGPPAMLKAFLEQVFRYGFAIPKPGGAGGVAGLLKGRSARLIVTMGMPAVVYRLVFGAFGVRAIERGVLWLSGVRPVRHTLFGGVGGAPAARYGAWVEQVRAMGARGA